MAPGRRRWWATGALGWTWAAVAVSVLLSAAIVSLHLAQRAQTTRSLEVLDQLGRARLDLAHGTLAVALSTEPGTPFGRAEGLTLIEQAITALERASARSDLGEPGPDRLRERIGELREALRSAAPGGARRETLAALRISAHQLDREAARFDDQIRVEMLARRDRLDRTFREVGGTAVVLLGLLCLAVFAGGRAKARSDRALAGSEARFREVIESLPQLVWTSTRDGHCDFVSSRWCEYTGMDRTSSLDVGWISAVHPDDRDDLAAAWRGALGDGTPFSREVRFRRHDGAYRWFDCRAVALRAADGRVERWFGANTDIDDSRRVREALAVEQALLGRIAATAPGAIFVFHRDAGGGARFPYVSPRMAELVGVAAEVLARDADALEERIHPDDRAAVLDQIGHARADGTPWRDEFRLGHPTRGERWLEVSAVGEPAGDGGSQWFGHLLDVTERKLAEERATRADKMEALGTLAGGVAHDFNNLLVAIIGNTELAQAELPKDDPVQPFLAEVLRASARAADLVRRILAFSRKEGSSRVRTVLAPLLREAVQMLRSTLPANVGLSFSADPEAPAVMASPSQLHQVVLNLVTNAAHAIGSRPGKIEVRLERAPAGAAAVPAELPAGDHVVISVLDDGVGIDPAVLGRIFDPFFTTKPQGQGTGLGLSTVHGIVRDHGGAITVESEPGCGATFRVWLPAVPVTDVGAGEGRPSVPDRLAHGRGERVFFVDDEEPLTIFASRALHQLGYAARIFTSPVEALDALRDDPGAADLLITDLTMPQMSGFELVRAVREVRPDLPIVLASGYLQQGDVERAGDLGVAELLAKPSRLGDLAGAIARALGRNRVTPPA